jgi:YgiT-type zinc finger domain-containing protein
MKDALQSRCPMCGGTKKPGKTTYSVDLGSGVVVRNVKATVCSQCGEEWNTAKRLEKIVQEARKKHRQVEVLAL